MARPAKQLQAFTTLTDRLLAVPRETLEKRLRAHRETPRVKPGPKPKAVRPTAS